MKKLWMLLAFLSISAHAADTLIYQGQTGKVYLNDASSHLWDASIVYTTDGNGHPVPAGGGTVTQGPAAATHASPWWMEITDGTHDAGVTVNGLKVDVQASSLPTGAATSALQTSGNTSLSSIAASVAGTLIVNGSAVTQPVSAASLPLPAGASTSALQTTGNSSLTSIAASVAGTLIVNGSGVTQPVSAASLPLPSGASTSALQTSGNSTLSTISSTLSSILSALGAALSVTPTSNTNGSISNNAAVTTTASTFTAPANAVGFLLEAESSNTANIRWAIGSTASASVGTIAESGRDTGYIPGAANISVVAISGTQAVSVQWILSH